MRETTEISSIASRLRNEAIDIADYLAKRIDDRSFSSSRSFYGETFSLALLEKLGYLNSSRRDLLLAWYGKKDKENKEFHWEFNVYALYDYFRESGDLTAQRHLSESKFKGTTCTNWTLLRLNSSIIIEEGRKKTAAILDELHRKLRGRQKASGLIEDDAGVRSFQYHAFSLCMLYEIYKKTEDKGVLKAFILGINFSRKFILRSGESLYIGRGQNQSFGYAALLYALSASYSIAPSDAIIREIASVVKYMSSFKRPDGSYPLVMCETEQGYPACIDVTKPEFFGWYPYNNYFDYLPFLGYFLEKAAALLREQGNLRGGDCNERKSGIVFSDNDFLIYRNEYFEAVVGRPGGYTSNDMSIPYILPAGELRSITPCYGGEQFSTSIYGPKGHALPYFKLFGKNISWRSRSKLLGRWLFVFSPLGIMIRSYSFHGKVIKIKTICLSPFNFENSYLVRSERDGRARLEISEPSVLVSESQYSASGLLRRFVSRRIISDVKIEL